MKKTVMRSYAKLIVRVGANVQKGQEVRVFASLDQPEFIKMLAEECYKAGASRVTVDWNYPELTKLSARYMKLRDLSETREWEKARMQDMVDHLPVRIFIESEDPDGLRGINPKYFKAFAARIKISKPYRDAIDNKHQWCIAAVPGEAWAKKVHPELSKRAAVEQLWKDILYTARADGEDPIADWEEHNRDLKARSKYLNDLHLRELRYHSANGTDFKVGLIPTAEFHAGRDTTMQGVVYDPNMPTEEVFTSPDRRTAEGIVYATKPSPIRASSSRTSPSALKRAAPWRSRPKRDRMFSSRSSAWTRAATILASARSCRRNLRSISPACSSTIRSSMKMPPAIWRSASALTSA